MRIISGKYKGRVLHPPVDNRITRPTTDIAREALFNILANQIDLEETALVADFFSGTGSVALEFVSRGCGAVVAVELSGAYLPFINKTMMDLNIDNLKVVKSDVFKFITKTDLQFDLIFADPPYALRNLKDLPDLIFNQNILIPNGLLIIEHDNTTNFTAQPRLTDHRKYGKAEFSFFR